MSVMKFARTMLRNLFSKPVTLNYPAEPLKYPERSRGHIEIKIDDCISCSMCVRSCPSSALRVDKVRGTWTINRFDCVACGYCAVKCPKKCLFMVPGYQEPMSEKSEETFQRSAESMAKTAPKPKKTFTPEQLAAMKAAAAKKKAAAMAAGASKDQPAQSQE